MTSLASGSCCSRWATSSSTALQVLSTRHGFTLLGKSHSLSLLASGGGGGGFSTVTWLEAVRGQTARIGTGCAYRDWPGAAPVVFRVAVLPLAGNAAAAGGPAS